MKKVIEQAETINVYKRLADEKADGGDLLGALGLYLTVLKTDEKNLGAIADVADCYADMGLLEFSNRYWFLYLTLCPKDKQGVAFEELAINYFYMENIWASGYYFHLKVDRDGFIAEEGLDEEILKFFSSASINKETYYLAYPFDKADYSSVVRNAKRAFAAGDVPLALSEYAKIPEECITEEASADYAAALFLARQDDEVIRLSKDSVSRFGENVNAYCNLSSLYHARGDYDKAEYYYKRALEVRKGDKSENFKLAACAIEREDHFTAKNCISEILKERPYDDLMSFFYAVSLVNLGEYDAAAESMNKALKINPYDPIFNFYAELFSKFCADNSAADNYLPLKYAKELPQAVERAHKKDINALINGKKSLKSFDEETLTETLFTALYSEDNKTAKSAAFLLEKLGGEKSRKILFLALLDSEVEDEVKNSIVYLLVCGGEKGRINVVLGNYYASVKPKKVVFEHKADGAPYMSAYALAVTKSLAWGIDDCAKIAFNMNTLYVDFAELIRFNGFGSETIAAICYLMCDFPRLNNVKAVCAAFGVDKANVSVAEEFFAFVKKTAPAKAKERAAKAACRKGKEKKENDVD